MAYLIGGIVFVLVLVLLYQIGTVFDLIAINKGQDDLYEKSNKYNALFMLGFMVTFLVGIVWSSVAYSDTFLPESSSEHGRLIDEMFNITLFWTGIIFFITQILLFIFAFKYRMQKGSKRKALFFPENDTLEIAWTVVPAIVLLGLLVIGVKSWNKVMSPPPAGSIEMEATAYQFGWIFRYPGADGKFGKRDYKLIDGTNSIGLDLTDEAAKDDIYTSDVFLPVDVPTLVKIRARDVLHNFYLPHFRVKMDAVPGIPTRFWFKPDVTTVEMRENMKDAEFEYELACAEMCGAGHYNMRRTVTIGTMEEFEKWLSEQVTFASLIDPDKYAMAESTESEMMETEMPSDSIMVENQELTTDSLQIN